jgi:iron-sulfur cluster assembly protein
LKRKERNFRSILEYKNSTKLNTVGKIVKFTSSAVREIVKLKEKEETTGNNFLRLGVKNGGCSGYSYIFEFDIKKENDIIEQLDEFDMIVDTAQASLILNLEVDYASGLNNRGFIFNNPNAKTTCGCGTSFS